MCKLLKKYIFKKNLQCQKYSDLAQFWVAVCVRGGFPKILEHFLVQDQQCLSINTTLELKQQVSSANSCFPYAASRFSTKVKLRSSTCGMTRPFLPNPEQTVKDQMGDLCMYILSTLQQLLIYIIIVCFAAEKRERQEECMCTSEPKALITRGGLLTTAIPVH